MSRIVACIPTLPTPTTLRAACTYSNSSTGWWWRPSVRRYDWISRAIDCSIAFGDVPGAARSSIGTIRGGSATIRGVPSTSPVRFA